MYEDDTTAYCIGDNFDIVTQRLNLIFQQICGWSQRNRLSIHNCKSEAMPLSTKPLIGPLQELQHEENKIDFVNSTSCLGVEIDNKLTWSPHIDKLCKSYRKKLGALRRMPRLPPKYSRKSISKQLYQESPIAFQYGVDVPHRYSIN